MRPDIAFVHTATAHVGTFERLVMAAAPGTRTRHRVVAPLLCDAQACGADDPALVRRIHEAMIEAACDGVPVVVCTCSTIGAAAERTPTGARFRAMRIDRPMADLAVQSGVRIVLVAALESTLAPTTRLLLESADAHGRRVAIRPLLVPQAWSHFERGDADAYVDAVTAAVRGAGSAADVVVLAQASMAPAADRLADLGVPVLASPRLGVAAALRLVAASRPE